MNPANTFEKASPSPSPSQSESDPAETPSETCFGLIVIGDEVLNGGRSDKHLAAFKGMLAGRGLALAWHWVLPDDPEVLTKHLGFARALGGPAFVCGGIGATPDDHTRACAAAAAGVPLVRHPEARALLEVRFGESAYPYRILMADLPAGSTLIPNPVNQIPGFGLDGHWYLPGFPQMAWPMAEWVLDRHYGVGTPPQEDALRVLEAPESQLIPIMESVGPRFVQLKMFSLPHLGADPHVLLGFRGSGPLEEAMRALRVALTERGIRFEGSTSHPDTLAP
jgi:molybdopterin-biosynthesis enzyme MoeA-like protein